MEPNIHICNTSEAPRSTRARDFIFYLDAIKALKLDREFSKLEAICTDGSILPSFSYQWRATSTMIPGDDDPFEGLGGTPIEAIRALYKDMKYAVDHWDELVELD